MKDNHIRKRSAIERLIIAKTLLESVLQDMPTAEPMTGLYVDGFNDGYEAGKEDAQQDIVHCKDCRWWREPDGCSHWDGMVTSKVNGFCSYAERRTDG